MVCALRDVLDATGAHLVAGDQESVVRGVSTDTRTLTQGALFFALRGPHFDGNAYAARAAEGGAAALLLRGSVDDPPRVLEGLRSRTPIALHPDPRRALGDLAAWHRARLDVPVIGVTGSCGKTTTKDILVELLSSLVPTVGSPSSYNNDVGVPLTLLLAGEETGAVVAEVGTSGPGEIAALCRIAKPTAGIITNVGPAHLERLGSLEGVAREKSALGASLPPTGFLVIDASSPFATFMRNQTSARVLTFSVDGEGDLNATDVLDHPAGTGFRLNGREVSSPLLGRHNVQNLLAAIAACEGLGFSLDDVLPAVAHLRVGRQRMERHRFGDVTVLDDSYNANPASMEAAVRVLAGFHGFSRRVLVLGDMLELGELSAEMHHALGVKVAAADIDLVVAVGELARAAAAGALSAGLDPSRVVHLASTEEARVELPGLVRDGDVVLVKGSRGMQLERVVEALRQRFAVGA